MSSLVEVAQLPNSLSPDKYIPTQEDLEKAHRKYIIYESTKAIGGIKHAWNTTPWGLANSLKDPAKALKYFFSFVLLGYPEYIDALVAAIKKAGWDPKLLKHYQDTCADQISQSTIDLATRAAYSAQKQIAQMVKDYRKQNGIVTEAIEKHETLNNKLFTKNGMLKDRVRDKMLEIVDTFVADLKEQEVNIKVSDVVFVGSNAGYNYTKNSDIDLHIIADVSHIQYPEDIAAALYSAFRSLFNGKHEIEFFGIPVELYVETGSLPSISNGIYSVKNNSWIKEPTQQEIPEYDEKKLKELVDTWETKCKELIDKIEDSEVNDETSVVKLIEDIYEKLRIAGLAKEAGEWSEENLAFKEIRNHGYLDRLKEYKNELIARRLSIQESVHKEKLANISEAIFKIAGKQPTVQDNGHFYLYDIPERDANKIANSIGELKQVKSVSTAKNGAFEFNPMNTQVPKQYYSITGILII